MKPDPQSWEASIDPLIRPTLFHGAIILSLVIHTSPVSVGYVAIAIGYATVSTVAFFAWLLVDLLKRATPDMQADATPPGRAPLVRSLLRLPSDYGLLCWVMVLWGVAIAGFSLFWWVYGLLFLANLVILLAALPVWFRQAKRL